MDADEAKLGEAARRKSYSERLNELHLAQAAEGKRERLLGYAKVALGVRRSYARRSFIHRCGRA